MNYGAADPGVSGGWAIINERMEVIERSDFREWDEFYFAMKRHDVRGFCLENVSIREDDSKSSGGVFMKNVGGYLALIKVLNIKMVQPTPQVWQGRLGVKNVPAPAKELRQALKALEKDEVMTRAEMKEAKKQIKKEISKITYQNKKAQKAKSIAMAKEFFSISDKLSDGQADALHMARYAVQVFHFGK